MTNVPNLRFQEFSGEWVNQKLENYVKYISSGKTKEKFENGTYKVYGSTGIIGYTEVPDYEGQHLLIARVGANAGIVNLTDEKCGITDNTLAIKYKNELNYKFSYYQLCKYNLNRLIFGSGQPLITGGQLKGLKLYFPNIEEQEKIASFFSLIDKKIALQTEKVEELKNYKKGIMQKIFSQELRFKDENGNDYPEWEEVNLRKILKEVNEKTTVINQYEVISSTNNGLYLQKDYFNREIASKDNIGYKILKRNQVVLSPQNLWMGNINLNSKYDIGMVSPSYKIFNIKSEFDSSYIGFVLRTDRAFYEYKQASEQGASIVRRNLNMDLFYDISFKLPCKAEQHKISKFINKIDCKIEQEMEKLDSLNQYKKGLLQQMFI